MHDNTTLNSSVVHPLVTLMELNDIEARKYLLVIIFVALLMLVGTPGNILVLYIYRGRFKRVSTSNYFIEALAIFDLIACMIGMPTEVYDLRYPYMFSSDIGCKILRFSETFTVIGSSMILLEVAIDRYWKVCRPHDKMSVTSIKIMCGIAAIVGILIAVPSIFYNGVVPRRIANNFISQDCTVTKPKLALIFFYLLCSIFFLICIILAVLYTLLYLEVRQRRRKLTSRQGSTEPEQISINEKEKQPEFPKTSSLRKSMKESNSKGSMSPRSPMSPMSPKSPSFPLTRARFTSSLRKKVSRTTLILFIVTLFFVISYLPSLLSMIIKFSLIRSRRGRKVSIVIKVIEKLFSKFFLINNACNPIIYSFLNPYFRKECVRVFHNISCGFSARCCRCCRVEPGHPDTLSAST